MMAPWRARPFAPRPLSPPLEAFVECVAATPYEWYVRPDGKLRTGENGTEMCAVTAVARYRMGRLYSVGDWIHAGECIGLSASDAALVVDAADGRSASGIVTRLRRRLVAAALKGRMGRPAPRTGTPHDPQRRRRGRSPRLALPASSR
jgi:hypothetical protein